MSDSVTIENSDGESFAEVIDIVGVSEIKKSFQQSVKEGSLHKWFKGSKSKDGKPGWVNVVTGGTCASDKPGEGTPKCVSASKRASMTKAERLSAARRKKKADPNQQAKSGAAKPTYVSTDKPKKKIKEAMTDYGSQTAQDDDDNKVAVAARKRIYDRASTKDKNMMDARTISQQRNKVRDERRKADQNKPEVDSVGTLVRSKLKVGEFKKMKESYGGKGVSRKTKLASTHPPTAQAAIKNIPTETDRGSGNKAKRRAGMPVEKKSPTYKAYVANKKSDGVKETYSNWREEVKRDEYGDIVGGPKISKKQKAKNLASNAPDEQHNSRVGESAEYIDLPLLVELPNTEASFKLGLMFRESLDVDKGMLFIFEEVGHHSFHMKNTRIPLDIAFVREDGIVESIKELTPFSTLPVYSDGEVLFAIEANRGWFTENNVEVGDEIVLAEVKDKKGKGSGKKDACYHKVKSRYSVWPSAYASGALVKCRKVGAKNWGNKSESVDMQNYLNKKAKKLDKQRSAQPDRYKNNPAFDSTSPDSKDPAVARSRAKYEEYNLEEAKKKKKAQKCWPGYEKKGTKMMFGKRYNNCVKKEEFSNWREEVGYEGKDDSKKIEEAKSPAWQRKEGKSESGGLNKKGVASYRAANPGSKLKTAVTTKPSKLKKGSKAAKRRKSFCARMKGMKKRLTSAKTARDPDSRINKSLRKWNC